MLVASPLVSFAQATPVTITATTPVVVATTTVVTPAVATTTTLATPAVVVSAGLVPGDFFYFLDRWSEALNLALTFNQENKARIHLEYAKERVAEINDVLKKPDAKLDDVKTARDNFDAQVAGATAIVKAEKEKGVDVSNLALEIDNELDVSHNELKGTLSEHKNSNVKAEMEIRAKIDAINASGTASTTSASELQGLNQALLSLAKEQVDATQDEASLDESVNKNQGDLEEVMGKEMSARKHLEQAIRLNENESIILSPEATVSSEKLMMGAQEAMKRGDFESARNMSKEVERAIEKDQEVRNASLESTMPRVDAVREMDREQGRIVGTSSINANIQIENKGEVKGSTGIEANGMIERGAVTTGIQATNKDQETKKVDSKTETSDR